MKSRAKTLQNDKERMVRPWVEISLCQHEKLKKIKERTGRPLSGMLREAVFRLVQKKKHLASTTVSYLAKGTRDRYTSVSAYFPRLDWSLLEEISKNTGKCKTELVRQALDEYLGR